MSRRRRRGLVGRVRSLVRETTHWVGERLGVRTRHLPRHNLPVIARALGAEDQRLRASMHGALELSRGGLRFQIVEQSRPGGIVTVLRASSLPGGVRIVPESRRDAVGRLFGRDDVATGDDAFDRAVWVTGPQHLVLGALDAPTRAAVRRALGMGATVEDGVWGWEESGQPAPERVVRLVQEIVAASRSWLHPGGDVPRLLDVARHDPLAPTRARALAALALSGPSAARSGRTVARSLLGGADPAAVLHGAGVAVDRAVAAAVLVMLAPVAELTGPLTRVADGLTAGSPEHAVVTQALALARACADAGHLGAVSVAAGGEVSIARGAAGEIGRSER